MEEISVEAEGKKRAIDVCTSCQFIWLDEGEWQDLAYFEVKNSNVEAVRDAVRQRIAKKRKERNAPPPRDLAPAIRKKPVYSRASTVHPRSGQSKDKKITRTPPKIAKHPPEIIASERSNSDGARRLERRRRKGTAQHHHNKSNRTQKHESGWGRGPTASWQWIPALLGMPVEDEQPKGPRQHDEKPWFTWFLSCGIVMVSLMAFLDLQAVVDNYGLIPADYTRNIGLTWITAFFLHADLLHLIGNVYFLVVFGDNVEKCLGTLEFFLLLCLATVSGHLFHILIDPDSTIPCIGASGGISGVIAFYSLRFRQNQLSVMFWFIFKTYRLQMNALWMFFIWVIFQVVVANQQIAGMSSVSGGAHLGGALAGVFVWLIWRLNHVSSY
ncbi:MAG: rhomboid family intramembrane serine protease, partial [Opitutales bacterium]